MDPMDLKTKYSKDCSEVEDTEKPSAMCLPSPTRHSTVADSRHVSVDAVTKVCHEQKTESFWFENESPLNCHNDFSKATSKEIIKESLDYSSDSVHQVCVTKGTCTFSYAVLFLGGVG